jgi:Flp pilus assembly protein TadG
VSRTVQTRKREGGREERREEGGYVVVATAILMTVLVMFVAVGIDASRMRDRTANVQRVADAAALAAASALPDLVTAQNRANESLNRNNALGAMNASVSHVSGRPGRVKVEVRASHEKSIAESFGFKTGTLAIASYAERSVGIPMGTPYNSIGTGDLEGTIPGNPHVKQGYFLAINGPCTAKEDGDRFMSLYDGTRGSLLATSAQNSDAYHCTEDQRLNPPESTRLWTGGGWIFNTMTPKAQWMRNSEYRDGGYSYIVDVPCDTGPVGCTPGQSIADPVYVDAWDPWFMAYKGEPPCPASNRTANLGIACVVDKIPMSNPDRNWIRAELAANFFTTKMAIYRETNGSFEATPIARQDFGASNVRWVTENAADPGAQLSCTDHASDWRIRRGNVALPVDPATGKTTCKAWVAINQVPLNRSGRYRIQVAADKVDAAPEFNASSGVEWKGPGSYGVNTYALRVRRSSENANNWSPCSRDSSGTCPTITGDGALSVYVKTPGDSSLFLSKMAPAQDYRGRSIQIQLWDPGEGAEALKIMMPVHNSIDSSGYKSIPFTWSTADPGLSKYVSGEIVEDRAAGWDAVSGVRVGEAADAGTGLDVSGSYGADTPWPKIERYSQAKFNGRMLLIDITIPPDYGKNAAGIDVPSTQFEGGWWKIKYESGSNVEDRTTWVVQSSGGPVHLTRNS